MRQLFYIFFGLVCSSCISISKEEFKHSDNKYASGFDISVFEDYTNIAIYNPWQKAGNTEFHYMLSRDIENIPDSLKDYSFIKLPAKKIVVLSTTHIGFIAALGEEQRIKAVSGIKYVYNKKIRTWADSGLIADIGYAPDIDYEKIVELEPDVVFLYGLESSVSGIISRLNEVGIPGIIIGEYLEKNPLGKLEWIKVFAEVLEKSDTAKKIFNKVEKNYLNHKKLVNAVSGHPRVLTGLPWKDTWYMTGGNTYQAHLIADAGGDFIWKENNSSDFIPMDLESVFMKALDADVWINTGSALSMNAVGSRDKRFEQIKAYAGNNVYNNDLKLNQFGGNDYWESGVVHPDLILRDLIKIFHPEKLKDFPFEYYRKLPED